MRVFADAYDAGLVHSFEVWNARGELAGGGYGIAVGGSFITESQFSRERDTSKLGFAFLNFHFARWGFAFNDGKVTSPTLRDMGFRDVHRSEYLECLSAAVRLPGRPGHWAIEADPREVADWRPEHPRDQLRRQ
jgi:leucyl/phenylalanyl-tRNA--protein transferase